MNTLKIRDYTIAISFLWLMMACNVTRNYQQPSSEHLSSPFRGQETASANTVDSSIATIPYQTFFKDVTLVDLINEGIIHNYDIAIALKQVESAEQSLLQAKWGNLPTANFTVANGTINRPSNNSLNGLTANSFLGQRYIGDYSNAVSFSWEADIWGKIKERKGAALANYLQTQEAVKAVKTKLVAGIATNYYSLLMLDAQLAFTKKSIALFDSTIYITKLQQNAGQITALAIQQQEAAREQALASIPFLEQQIGLYENAISILTGKNPTQINRSEKLSELIVPDQLATGIPANLVSNRADVKQKELIIRQSVALENVAHTSMYPSLNITAQGGLDAFKASNWFNIPGSLFGIIAGSVTQPLLQGRQLKTRYEQAKISTEQAELQFKQSVLVAVGEVSDALIQLQKLKEQETLTLKQIETLHKAVGNSNLLFKSGMATYIEVLSAQGNKLQAELNLASIQRQHLNAMAGLYKALGGGWQ